MVERVARALARRMIGGPRATPERIAQFVEDTWRDHELDARDAVRAMRELSAGDVLRLGMAVLDANRALPQDHRSIVTCRELAAFELVWRAAIDAALAPPSKATEG